MFSIINNLKDGLSLVAVAAALWFGYSDYLNKQEVSRITNNLNQKTSQWEDERGRLVTEVTELRVTNKELKSVAKKDSSNLSKIEKTLLRANKEIEALKIKAKDVESYNEVLLESRNDNLVTEAVYNEDKKLTKIEPIMTDHLFIKFHVKEDTIIVNHLYRARITTVVDRERDKTTKNGNKRFFLARLVNPRWQYSAKNVADDRKAILKSAVHINFQRRKGKRK